MFQLLKEEAETVSNFGTDFSKKVGSVKADIRHSLYI